MRKIVCPQRPATIIAVNVYPDGQAYSTSFFTPRIGTLEIQELIETVKRDINSLPSLTKLQAAIEATPQPAEETIDPQQAQQVMTRNAEEASLIQSFHELPVAIVLTVDPKGQVVAGYATAAEYSSENVKRTVSMAAASLSNSPEIALLQATIRNMAAMTN